MIEQGVDVATSVACGPACAGNPLMRLAALILCLVLAGPVMFLCGVSYLFDTATDTRGSAIKVSAKLFSSLLSFTLSLTLSLSHSLSLSLSLSQAYNNQVGAWQSMVQQTVLSEGQFMNTTMEFAYKCNGMSNLNHKSELYNLTFGYEPEDEIVEKNKEGMKALQPQYKYYYERPQTAHSSNLRNCEIDITIRSNSTTLVQFSRPYMTTELVKCNPKDTFRACSEVLYLSDVCVKVKWQYGKYVLDKRFPAGEFGCFYDDDSKSFKPTQYLSGDEPYFMNLMVRFSDDPYLTYMEETDGTGKFGLDSGGKIKLGVSLLVMGALICMLEIHVFKQIRGFVRSGQGTMRPSHPIQRFYYDSADYYNRAYARDRLRQKQRNHNFGTGPHNQYSSQQNARFGGGNIPTSYPAVNNRTSFGVYQPTGYNQQPQAQPTGYRIDNPLGSPSIPTGYPGTATGTPTYTYNAQPGVATSTVDHGRKDEKTSRFGGGD